jgi:ribosome biogenesis GTPase / thiamine phosphate phosphatase
LNTVYNLNELGWNKDLEKELMQFRGEYSIGRIAVEYKNMYKVFCEEGEFIGVISGKMNYTAVNRQDYPAVGDWVIIDRIKNNEERRVIRSILNRKSKFSRKIAGKTFEEQIVATNIDIAFLCMSLNQNFNLRRLERYITMAWDSGAAPVILLTKSDLCDDLEDKLEQTMDVAIGVDIHCISCISKSGIEEIKSYIKPGKTVAFFGSSGVGKSTIINELAGESKQDTKETSDLGDRGRHTTTNRELILLEGGGVVIDTPGMREIHILDVEESVDAAFEDIEELSKKCKFSDCTHDSEPRCAVREAIESGLLTEERFLNYLKLKREAEFMERKNSKKAELQYKKSVKKMSNDYYNNKKYK